jgi:hypothetical protein
LVEDVSDGLGGEGAATMSLGQGEFDVGRAVLIEQSQEATRGAAEVRSVQRDFLSRKSAKAPMPSMSSGRRRTSAAAGSHSTVYSGPPKSRVTSR